MKKIIVFGATGGTGKYVVEQALQKGFQTTVVVRNPAAFKLKHDHLTIIKGDVFQPSTFEAAVAENDAVVSCLGIHKKGFTTVYSEGIANILKAMKKGNANRLVCISAGAVIVPPESSFMTKFITKNILQRIFRNMYADMLEMEKTVTQTDLEWTIIRAPWLRDTKYTGSYRTAINEHLPNPSKISRADLAHYIVSVLDDRKHFKAIIEISY